MTVSEVRADARGDLERALDEVTDSSAGGAPFLFAFGLTIAVTGLLAFVLPAKVAALIAMFQGNAALPIAFLIQGRMGRGKMAADNPLRPLSIQLAMSQVLGLPVVIIVYNVNPAWVPAALASIAGAHFIPYTWLQRSSIFIVLGSVVSLGAFALSIVLQNRALPWVLLFIGACYFAAAPLLLRNARVLAARRAAR